MPKYIVHIGPPKTATTFLQSNFTALAPWLAQNGVLYPTDLGTPGHANLPRMLTEPDAETRLKPIFAEFNAGPAHTILLSAEDLAPLRRQGIETLRRLIGQNLVYIVYYCRRWSEMIRSRWGERVKHGSDITLIDSFQEAIDTPFKVGAINYDLALTRWTRTFGMAALRVVSLNVLSDTNREVLGHFLQSQLGLAFDRPPPEGAQNMSMSLTDTEILRALNALHIAAGNKPSAHIRRAFVRSRKSLDFNQTSAAIGADMTEIIFDESRPRMLKIHREMFDKYAFAMVPPALDGLFFQPGRAIIPAPGANYLKNPAVHQELSATYARLAAMKV